LQNFLAKWSMEMAIIGYARVSTQDQHLTGQLEALKAAGAETIYREKISGARADRPQLAKLTASLKAGDVVLVTKLDRLGRSTRELLDLIEAIGKAGAAFRSLGDPLWDTSSSQGRLLSTLLAAIAEFERDLIRERTGEGRKRAMAKGVKFGRKPKLSEFQRREALKRRAAGETMAELAEVYGVSEPTIWRALQPPIQAAA
jgi:DNA invertase Pin-like site-specific DNA recombinase